MMAKREFLMLAHVFKDQDIGGWFVSEKLDGMRAFWDGGISRGTPTGSVPWANTLKDARYKKTIYATGLWTRGGKAIQAPVWWLDKLPEHPLDGELYMGCGNFQKVMSTVKSLTPGEGWTDVEYHIFDQPCLTKVLGSGTLPWAELEED